MQLDVLLRSGKRSSFKSALRTGNIVLVVMYSPDSAYINPVISDKKVGKTRHKIRSQNAGCVSGNGEVAFLDSRLLSNLRSYPWCYKACICHARPQEAVVAV